MRTENVKISMEFPLHINEPDGNGVIYTKETWKNAIKDAVSIPIEIINNDGTRVYVGIAKEMRIIEENENCNLLVSGILRNGGTCEDIDFADNVVTSINLQSIGITN